MVRDWPDTSGSQFFIALSPQPHLDGRYTAFAKVVSGMDIVDELRQGDAIRRVPSFGTVPGHLGINVQWDTGVLRHRRARKGALAPPFSRRSQI